MDDTNLIKKYKIKSKDRVLDIGGSMMQHEILKIDTLVDIIRPEEAPYGKSILNAKNFVQLDITKSTLPFKDKEFDFVLCTQTIEDLYNPFLILSEMERVAKRGLIVSPSMGADMVFGHVDYTDWLTGPRRMPGHAHHKWFLQIVKNNTLLLVPKIYPILYTSEFHFIDFKGPKNINYYWEDKLNFIEFNALKMHDTINEYRKFVKRNKNLFVKQTVIFYVDDLYSILRAYLKKILRRGIGYSDISK